MKVKFITVGKIKDLHLAAKVGIFTTRLNRFAKVSFRVIKDSKPAKEARMLCELLAKENGFKF